MALYLKQFENEYDFPKCRPSKFLVLATTPRSGSHLLARHMFNTGCLGYPLEYLHKSNFKQWSSIVGESDMSLVLEKIAERRTSPNGVFSVKTHYTHLQALGSIGRLNELLPGAYFVYLRRRCCLSQAISLYVAKKTGIWIADKHVESDINLDYSYVEIKKCLRVILLQNAGWQYLFTASGQSYTEVVFEDMLDDPSYVLSKICDYVGVDLKQGGKLADLTKKQSGKTTEEWIERFRADHNKRKFWPFRL